MAARVVQEQDGAVSPAQMAVRVRPPRSSVKALIVRPVTPGAIRPLIIEHHYLHNMPAVCWRAFGVYADGELAGAVVFTPGPRQGFRVLGAGRPQQVATLARLWLRDDLPKNAESRILGVVLRDLRRDGRWKLILSYADPAAGHLGTIYQAAGWLYLGQGNAGSYLDIGDGTPRHPRTVYGALGANAVGHLRRTGIPARRCPVAGKHRYVFLLDSAWRWRLRQAAQPYPKTDRP